MMYQDRLAVALKSNGKVLREFKDTVYLPFGSEYSILIKNLHSRRALVRVSIDGVDTTDGIDLVINANSSLDLERFIKNANIEFGNRFKFIERTAKIENGPRGIKVEDGLVRIEFEFEREPVPITSWPTASLFRGANGIDYHSMVGTTLSASGASSECLANNATYSVMDACFADYSATAAAAPANDVGITVPGSKSDQKFHEVAAFPTDGVKHVMVIKLLGETEAGQQVTAPVTVKTKPKCVTCGHLNKAASKFCSECGTALEIL